MSHGSKKWIKDYRGRWKRSRNRTKDDYIAEAKHGKHDDRIYWRWSRKDPKPKCPQCRYVWKQFDHDAEEYFRVQDEIYAEFRRKYGSDRNWVQKDGKTLWVWEYFRQHPRYPGPLWSYHWRTFLCFKCEQRENAMDKHWHNSLGSKKSYNWQHKNERRKYRAQMKQKMRNEEYDDLVPRKKDWH